MFVRTSTYNQTVHEMHMEILKERGRALTAELRLMKALRELEIIKSKQHLNGLSNDDIKRLLMLCHPDKHGGKEMARQMTTKLLTLRKR